MSTLEQQIPLSQPEIHDDALDAELGLGVLKALNNSVADNVQAQAVRDYQEGNLSLWRNRLTALGADAPGPAPAGDGDMQTVRIRSPENHYHLPPAAPTPAPPAPEPAPATAGVPGWVKGAAVVAGLGGSAALGALGWDYFKGEQPPAASTVGLNPGGLTIEVVKDPQ